MIRILCFWTLLSVAYSGHAEVSATSPAIGSEFSGSPNGHLTGSTVDYVELNNGTFAIRVYARFQAPRAPNQFVDAGVFMLVNGTIMRNGDRLFWSLNGKVVEVAQTYEWSTFPKWSSHYDIVQVHLQKTRGPLPEYYSASVSLSAN